MGQFTLKAAGRASWRGVCECQGLKPLTDKINDVAVKTATHKATLRAEAAWKAALRSLQGRPERALDYD